MTNHFLLDLTWISYFIAAVVIYYSVLFVMSLFNLTHTRRELSDDEAMVVLLVPAHNEETVIADTLRALADVDYDAFHVLVINDNSTDNTGQIVRQEIEAEGLRDLVTLVDRTGVEIGGGKSGALNFGLRALLGMIEAHDPRLRERPTSEIVVGILDADGRLESHALIEAIPMFDNPEVGTVQIGVRIENAATNLLARMQDMEFVGFSCLVQIARDRFGSSGLGGNGQFNRLSALLTLEREPWSPTALTEDLDLGLMLVEKGWRTRFCPRAFVYQQGLTKFRPLLRQRTRWIQGHYQCWKHIPLLFMRRPIRLATRLDLALYLVLVTTVMLVSYALVVGLLASFGVLSVTNNFLPFLHPGLGRRIVQLVFAIAPGTAFLVAYQRFARQRLRAWEVPAYGLVFTVYSYMWVTATLWAWTRIVLRRWSWVKTPRVQAVS